ncbi:MAG TPA: response regulator [Polyangiaceae bacterium]|nr:response regulator [Polyangiaceae bacterium]
MQPLSRPALVLIVDDNPLNLEVLFTALEAEGLDVAVARDGETALKHVGYELPDLILLDALMPGLDGFETCRRLKADPKTRDVPVMFMTSLVDTRSRLEGFGAGAVDYVTKPFERAELVARVRTQISLRLATLELEQKNARLERRTEELLEANERISRELAQREAAEAERAALQEQIIAIQRDRLLELSAPIIPINEGVLVMPLIGSIDGERAARTVEAALRGAEERRAEYLIIDLTGVKAVDATVGDMLERAAKSLDLIGTRLVITGITPKAAQTLVGLSLCFDRMAIKATLQAGVTHALSARQPRAEPSADRGPPSTT